MKKSEKKTFVHSVFLLVRNFFVFSVILAVAVLALFWESLPDRIKNTITFLSSTPFDNRDDEMIPGKFRIEKKSEISDNFYQQSPEIPQIANLHYITNLSDKNPILADDASDGDTVINGITHEKLQITLKELGVTSCQLSYWGNNRNMFRFSCQVWISERHPTATKTFQSISPDAKQSIEDVIDQIHQWRDRGSENREKDD